MRALAGGFAVDREADGIWLLTLDGEHDISTVPRIERETREVWPSCGLMVVDLSAVSFIDGSVVNWLLRTRGRLAEDGRHALRIVRGPPEGAVARVFEILRLDQEFACYRTREDALLRLPPLGRPPVGRHARQVRERSRSTSPQARIGANDRGLME